MPIRAVGVWDTVGALGIPLPWKGKNVKEYSFVNTKVARHVLNAFHALALDEHRNLFTPTLWEQSDPCTHALSGFDQCHQLLTLKQTWFPGVHSNIGGSYVDAGISNISLVRFPTLVIEQMLILNRRGWSASWKTPMVES